MTLKINTKFEEKPIRCFKTDKDLLNFDRSTQKSQKFTLWFVPSVKNMQSLIQKSTEEFSFTTQESDKKFEEKMTFVLENNEEFDKFSPEHFKVGTQCLDFYGTLLSQVENVWA